MVDSVANVLLETLRDLLIEEVKFLSGVSHEVKKVEADLRTLHGLLMDADINRNRNNSHTLRNWMDQLKELAFRAENVLETYSVKVESKREGKSLKKKLQRYMCILCECDSVHEVGKEINDIRSSLSDLTTRLTSIARGGGEASSASAEQEQKRLLRLRYAHEVDQHFVGMENDIHSLVSMVKEDSSVSVISICGMGGLGKTTLARKIYHHQDLRHHFVGRAWVCVTQQFQAETILKEILQQIGGIKPDMVGLSDSVRGLYNVLERRKYLIVIDDIWETDHWNILKPAFPTKNCQVIVTTRNEKIASQEGHVHKLGFLSEDEGWELLQKIAFPINNDPTQGLESRSTSFEDIGRQMVQKCGRLPLAISVIGGILHQKQQIFAEWEKVSMNLDTYLKHGGEGIENDTRVKLVLDLSFNVLPYYLKPCFLYLACFPEDDDIDTEQLYLLWMGEGLIFSEEKGNNETLRDVAERYLTELAFRCMVQVESGILNTPHNRFKSCRLHDLMRGLCSSKAEEEKFIKRVDFPKHMQSISSTIGASIHRVAINLLDDDDATIRKLHMAELKDLRSFLFLSKNRPTLGAFDYANIMDLENSKYLRILMLGGVQFEDGNLPSRVGKQIYLKYLSLHRCNVHELPQHICNLPYLQTLDLRVRIENKIKLPNLIWKMKRLRHLFLPSEIEVIGGDKLRLDGLNELETLEGINSKSVCVADVINLPNLHIVNVVIEEDTNCLSEIVDYLRNNKCKLRETSLEVRSCELRSVLNNLLMIRSLIRLEIFNCEIGCNFPSYEQGMSPNLTYLEVMNSKIVGDVMDVLGKFPMLRWLWLGGEIFEGVSVEMRCGANSFPELKRLFLSRVKNLHKWEQCPNLFIYVFGIAGI